MDVKEREKLVKVAKKRTTNPEVLRDLFETHKEDFRTAEIAFKVLENPSCPLDLIERCAGFPQYGVYITKNPASSPELLQTLYDNGLSYGALQNLLSNPNCPYDLIETAVFSQRAADRVSASKSPFITAEHLAVLADDKDVNVRAHTARHKNLSVETREWLLTDASDAVLSMMAARKDTTATELRSLSARGGYRTRRKIAANRNCPVDLALNMLNALQENKIGLKNLAKNTSVNGELFDALWDLGMSEVRVELLKQPNCPEHIVHIAVTDVSAVVREAVASSSLLSEDQLTTLAFDSVPRVQKAAAKNPKCPKRARVLVTTAAS